MLPVAFGNQLLGFLTFIGQIIIGALFIALSFRKSPTAKQILSFVAKNGLLFSFIVALTAMLGSLFYSEIAKYEPCVLCWYQRILMYPNVLLLGLAYAQKDRHVIPYSLALAIPGLLLSGYHYLLQRNIVPAITCGVVGYSASCSTTFFMQFGYITIPFMAFTAFLLIILFLTVSTRKKRYV